jgi:hypothetical protein
MCWMAAVAQWVTLAAGSCRAVGRRHVRELTTRWRSTTCGSRAWVGREVTLSMPPGEREGGQRMDRHGRHRARRKGALRLCAARHPDDRRRCRKEINESFFLLADRGRGCECGVGWVHGGYAWVGMHGVGEKKQFDFGRNAPQIAIFRYFIHSPSTLSTPKNI